MEDLLPVRTASTADSAPFKLDKQIWYLPQVNHRPLDTQVDHCLLSTQVDQHLLQHHSPPGSPAGAQADILQIHSRNSELLTSEEDKHNSSPVPS